MVNDFDVLPSSVLHRGASKYQEIALLDTKHFGKVRSHQCAVPWCLMSVSADFFFLCLLATWTM
jgi:hypothetical protein